MIQINAAAMRTPLMPANKGRGMRVSNLEVAGIATIILSLAVLALIGFSMW
jgi:hypothetical protein